MKSIIFLFLIKLFSITVAQQSNFNDIYEKIRECCTKHGYDGTIVPIPEDLNNEYGNCYKCCCMHYGSFENSSSTTVFNIENDFMYLKFYLYNFHYEEAFKTCATSNVNDLNGIYFHKFRKCMAKELQWNTALNATKVYYFLREITKKAPTEVAKCKDFTFKEIYIDSSEKIIFTENNTQKACIASIYQITTNILRELNNFTAEYGLKDDIFFYYKSENYRDNYRKCIKDYVRTSNHRKQSDIYNLLSCSSERGKLNEFSSLLNKSTDCGTDNIKLMEFSDKIKDENRIEAYGKAYTCVLKKFFSYVETQYYKDIDVFFEYFDYGAFRLSYKECVTNPKYQTIHEGIVKNNFHDSFFGNLKKCINDRMSEIDKEGSFLKIGDGWNKTISAIRYSNIIF